MRLPVKRLLPTRDELGGYSDPDEKDVFQVNAPALLEDRKPKEEVANPSTIAGRVAKRHRGEFDTKRPASDSSYDDEATIAGRGTKRHRGEFDTKRPASSSKRDKSQGEPRPEIQQAEVGRGLQAMPVRLKDSGKEEVPEKYPEADTTHDTQESIMRPERFRERYQGGKDKEIVPATTRELWRAKYIIRESGYSRGSLRRKNATTRTDGEREQAPIGKARQSLVDSFAEERQVAIERAIIERTQFHLDSRGITYDRTRKLKEREQTLPHRMRVRNRKILIANPHRQVSQSYLKNRHYLIFAVI